MSNRISSVPARSNAALLNRHAGRLTATDELAIKPLGDDYTVEGSGTVTRLPAMPKGTSVTLYMAATPTFTNSARLICPYSANYTAVAGDLVLARSNGDGVWQLYLLSSSASAVRTSLGVPGLAAANTFSGANTFSNGNTFSGSNTFSAAQTISDTTASTSTSTGALKISGGIGVAGAGWFGGGLHATGSGATAGASLFLNNTGTSGIQWAIDSTDTSYSGDTGGNFAIRKVGALPSLKIDGSGNLTQAGSITTTVGAFHASGSGATAGASVFLANTGTSGVTWAMDSTDTGYSEGGGVMAFRQPGSFSALILKTNNLLRLPFYGAGTLTTDGSGNVTASSDEGLKIIKGSFTRGSADLKNIVPILYSWNEESGHETEGTYAGFSAQNVQLSIPEAIGVMQNGSLTLQERPLLATVINAINELATEVAALKAA